MAKRMMSDRPEVPEPAYAELINRAASALRTQSGAAALPAPRLLLVS